MPRKIPLKWLTFLIFLWGFSQVTFSSEPEQHQADHQAVDTSRHAEEGHNAHEEAAPAEFDAGKVIMDHISDSHEWHFFSIKKKDGTYWDAVIYLPVTLYSPGKGLDVFSYKHLHHSHDGYRGYKLNEEHKIIRADGGSVYDFSFTKNVIQLLISMLIMLWLFISVARNYHKYGVKAPRGVQSAVEVIVMFIRDQIAKPMLGKNANKFLPYLLTLFFFIWINNLLGLIPGAANVTGNIAVTATLAAFTFILMMVSSRRGYWLHMIAPPGVPLPVKFILVPIEFMSNIIIKPFALMIRLFANMLAGHLIVLSFMCIIFIFAALHIVAGLGASVFSVAFTIFIYMLELLVAALQAYIFTILTALFISETMVEHSHEEHH